MQVGETAVDQRPDEIQRQGRPSVGPQHDLGIRLAVGRGEPGAVDQVAPVAWQRFPVPRLVIGAAGLGVLSGHAADADDRLAQADEHDERHLQQDLDFLDNVVRSALVEVLRAIAALQQKCLTALGGCEVLLQSLDLPARHERRQLAEFAHNRFETILVGISGLLGGVASLPTRRMPIRRCAGLSHAAHYTNGCNAVQKRARLRSTAIAGP